MRTTKDLVDAITRADELVEKAREIVNGQRPTARDLWAAMMTGRADAGVANQVSAAVLNAFGDSEDLLLIVRRHMTVADVAIARGVRAAPSMRHDGRRGYLVL